MISPADLWSYVGVCGQLVPFWQSVVVYFAADARAPGWPAVAAKCAPVLSLLLLLLLHATYSPHPKVRYVRLVCLGLALSAVGDALLVWPQQLAAGMAAFGAAHVCYVCALRLRPRAPLVALACACALAGYLPLLAPRGELRLLVPLYALLLAATAWRGLARALHAPPKVRRFRRAAAAGALLFAGSDAVLGLALWGARPVPQQQALVMGPYYLAQMALALSALEPAHTHTDAHTLQ